MKCVEWDVNQSSVNRLLCSADTRRAGFAECEHQEAENRGPTAQRASRIGAAATAEAVGPT